MVSIEIAFIKKVHIVSFKNPQLMLYLYYEFAFYESQYHKYRSYSSREPPDYLLK
jgi:hypothetical protein